MTNDHPMEENAPMRPENAGQLEALGLEDLARELRNNTDPLVRQYSAYLLGKAHNPWAIQPLIEALADFDKSVREQATLALSRIGKSAIEPLADAMNEPKWQTRYRAAEALGRIADDKAVKPLIRALKDNRDHVRYMAAKGLKQLGDSDAIEPMVILLKDENPYVKLMAVRALGTIGGAKAEDALKAALGEEKDEKIRDVITEALS